MSVIRLLGLFALAALAFAVEAAHPLISEDTGTQGAGRTELELGTATAHVDGGRVLELDPQLSYGALDTLDLIVRPSLFYLSGGAALAADRRQGFGTTALDVKWRAFGEAPWTFGLRGGLDLPTATVGLGPHQLGHHVLLMATYDAAPLMITTNLAYAHLPRDSEVAFVRRDLVRLSAGLLSSLSDTVRLAGDLALARAADATEHGLPAVGLLGLIVRTPVGIDVDAGYQFPLNRAAPTGVWLLGATLRW
jgi:hypothetical protein